MKPRKSRRPTTRIRNPLSGTCRKLYLALVATGKSPAEARRHVAGILRAVVS